MPLNPLRNQMRLVFFVVACIAWRSAPSAGLQQLELPGAGDSQPLKGAVWSPCDASKTGAVRMRRITVPGVRDCPVHGTALPLVVISHGARGWFGGHHDTASALADAGFVVAAVTHPDISRTWQTQRPATVKRLIDHMLGNWPDRHRLDPTRIGFFGFSRGGYTGLVALGATPDFRRIISHCQQVPADSLCKRRASPTAAASTVNPRSVPRTKRTYVHDSRVKAAVIAAPLGLVFPPETLKKINVPIQLWRPEHDALASHPHNAQAVHDALPQEPDYHVIKGAGHFAILAPCTQRQAQAVPRLCLDAGGFDRVAFHKTFNEQIIAFFKSKLRLN